MAVAKARIRTIKHVQKQAARQLVGATATGGDAGAAETFSGEDTTVLPPGQIKLYSYYAPGLVAGSHKVTVNHHIQHPTDTRQAPIDVTSTQKFDVNAPRFVLPPGIVHQTYPPQGMADHNNVLPHIVFEDPHLPWEQQGSPDQDKLDEDSTPRNKVPWLALWTFTEDEIKLSNAELLPKSQNGLFPETVAVPSTTNPPEGRRQQNKTTFSVRLTMTEYLEMGHGIASDRKQTVTIPVVDENDGEIDQNQQVDVIFVPRDLFEDFVAPYNTDGSRAPIPPDSKPDVSRYAQLAHTRKINTLHMANVGIEDTGLYSVVLAHRTGPLDLQEPRPIVVHLVSIQDVEDNIRVPLDATKPATNRVALISLYSWTYMCLPPEQINFVDALRHVGKTVRENGESWLRAPDQAILSMAGLPISIGPNKLPIRQQLDKLSDPHAVPSRLAKRLEDGYSLQRYLFQTGEENVAFYRGPLTPTYVPPIKEGWWPTQSNFSTDYQVLDPALGIVDISYSAAWQLGRTLGIADQSFTAALNRLRAVITTTAIRKAKADLKGRGLVKSKKSTVASLVKSMDTLNRLSASSGPSPQVTSAARFTRPTVPTRTFVNSRHPNNIVAVGDSSLTRTFFASNAVTASSHMGSARTKITMSSPTSSGNDGSAAPDPDEEVYIPFNEINVPASSDWQIVQAFVLDKLSLHNIPAHYYLPDPSQLPRESLRFFYIDTNWFDAFIDGALSIGNHLEREDDVVRQALKRNLNRYFNTPLGTGELSYMPQIPCFGFLFRSGVVTAFPNLEVHAPWPDIPYMQDGKPVLDKNGKPVMLPNPRLAALRIETVEKDTLLCLFDRMPGQSHWCTAIGQCQADLTRNITISQPPHQQCFQLGVNLTGGNTAASPPTDGEVDVEFISIYTIDAAPPANKDKYRGLDIITWMKSGAGALEPDAHSGDASRPTKHPHPITTLPKQIFDYSSRTIIVPSFAKACLQVLNTEMTSTYFLDDTPTSALTASVLGNFLSKMEIQIPQASSSGHAPSPPDTTVTPRRILLPQDLSDDQSTWITVPAPTTDPGLPPPGPAPPTDSGTSTDAPPGSLSPPAPSPKPTAYPTTSMPGGIKFPADQITDLPAGIRTLGPSIGSQFISSIFQLGKPLPRGSKGPVNLNIFPPKSPQHGIPIDIVVRIICPAEGSLSKQYEKHNLQLFNVTVDMPVGTAANALTTQYQGPGAKMLSNLRFNIHVDDNSATTARSVHGTPGGSVRFNLVPRSTSKLTALSGSKDLSFVIWQVVVSNVEGQATFVVQENYRACDKNVGVVTSHFATATASIRKGKVTS